MSGHNKWSQIKNKKGTADAKRGQLFGKLLKAISIAAKSAPNPQFNPRLRSAIEQAKKSNVPLENIERAISKAGEEKNLEDVTIEAYGPEGVAMIIEAITDNTNRTINEIRHILDIQGAKMANQGSVLWSFEQIADERGPNAPACNAMRSIAGRDSRGNWQPKFKQPVSQETTDKISQITEALEEHDDVQKVITNI